MDCNTSSKNGQINVMKLVIENQRNYIRSNLTPIIVQALCRIGCFVGSGCLVNECSDDGNDEGLCGPHKKDVQECLYDLGMCHDSVMIVVRFVTAV